VPANASNALEMSGSPSDYTSSATSSEGGEASDTGLSHSIPLLVKGGVCLVVVLALIVAGIGFYLIRRKGKQQSYKAQTFTDEEHAIPERAVVGVLVPGGATADAHAAQDKSTDGQPDDLWSNSTVAPADCDKLSEASGAAAPSVVLGTSSG